MAVELDRIRGIVEEIVASQSLELVDLELKGAGRQRVLRIFIDKEGGVTHGDCEWVSAQVGTVLDVEDVIPFSYTLEVSSPGLDRKLFKPEDFKRFAGRLARIQTKVPLQSQKVFKGRLAGFEDGKIRLECSEGGGMEIPMDVVREARLEVDWEAELKAGRSR